MSSQSGREARQRRRQVGRLALSRPAGDEPRALHPRQLPDVGDEGPEALDDIAEAVPRGLEQPPGLLRAVREDVREAGVGEGAEGEEVLQPPECPYVRVPYGHLAEARKDLGEKRLRRALHGVLCYITRHGETPFWFFAPRIIAEIGKVSPPVSPPENLFPPDFIGSDEYQG